MSECQLSCTDHCVLRNGQGGKGQPQTEQQDEGSGMRALDAVCIGEAMGQLVPLGGQSVETATDFQLRVAGAEANVAIGLAQLGHRVSWVSRVGDDALGRRLLLELHGAGVATDDVAVDSGRRTGLFVKVPDRESSTVVYYREGSAASAIDVSDIDRVFALGSRIIHLSGVTPALSPSCLAATENALSRPRPQRNLLSFDVNYRAALWPGREKAAETLLRLAQQADVVFVGFDEAEELWGAATPAACRELLSQVPHLVVKDGSRAAIEYAGSRSVTVPALSVPVLEPVGAGDAFASGWLHGWLGGHDAMRRLRLGHLMAGRALTSLADHSATPIDVTGLHLRAENGWASPPSAL
ncbi:MAG: hypothetical protein B5766_11295 [Candidatus Lumbricidophila eiseniae]|uniref:Carbohydrate kinase PfkB domain-containing protein n=1 Tax=Candidatus Lumbricidiphila eiseniae TaxID=1969409 RepID=A0A2A6FQ19_9MICO|nr:MAG: hypothetical protein B5766_11295 [Candidatus Lumbricidophila eiseniae]